MKRIILTFFILCFCAVISNAQENASWHTVKKGETLFGISKKYQTTIHQIKQDNPRISKDLSIKIGQKLKVRQDQSLGSNYGKVIGNGRSGADNSNNAPVVHKVKKGETLWSIAKNTYNIEVAQLRQWNNIVGSNIKEGQELVVGYKASNANYNDYASNDNSNRNSVNVSYTLENTAANAESARLTQEQIKQLPVFNPDWHKTEGNPQEAYKQNDYPGPWNSGKKYNAPAAERPEYKITKNTRTTEPIIIKESDDQNAIYTTPVSNMSYTRDEVSQSLANTKTSSILENNELLRPSMASGKTELRNIYNEMRFNNLDKLDIKMDKGPALSFETNTPNSDMFILHRTLPVGTVVKISNPVNDYTIYTKVAGKLPDTGENSKALLKMSNRAKELLNAHDKIFMVELEYMISKGGRVY